MGGADSGEGCPTDMSPMFPQSCGVSKHPDLKISKYQIQLAGQERPSPPMAPSVARCIAPRQGGSNGPPVAFHTLNIFTSGQEEKIGQGFAAKKNALGGFIRRHLRV